MSTGRGYCRRPLENVFDACHSLCDESADNVKLVQGMLRMLPKCKGISYAVRFLAFAGLGMATEIVIAWLCVLSWGLLATRSSTWHLRAPVESISPARGLTISRVESFGIVTVSVHASDMVPVGGRRIEGDDYAAWPQVSAWNESRPLETMAHPWSLKAVIPAAVDREAWPDQPGMANVCLFAGLASGWPLACLSLAQRYDPSTSLTQEVGALYVPGVAAPRTVSTPLRLPYSPMWTQLLVNTAILGGGWYLVFLTPRAIRLIRHLWRGGCSRCGYEISGVVAAVCPECGAPIPATVRRRYGVVVAARMGPPPLALACSVGVAAAICFIWLASGVFHAHGRGGSCISVGVQNGAFQVLFHYAPPASAAWINAGLNDRMLHFDWMGGSERLPDLLTISLPLWIPFAFTLVLSSVLVRRSRRRVQLFAHREV